MGAHKTYRGIEIKHYRKMRDSMDAEAFAKWVKHVTGKPRGKVKTEDTRSCDSNRAGVDWETLAKRLQGVLAVQMKENEELGRLLEAHQQRIIKLENKSWLSRLFNLKG